MQFPVRVWGTITSWGRRENGEKGRVSSETAGELGHTGVEPCGELGRPLGYLLLLEGNEDAPKQGGQWSISPRGLEFPKPFRT